MISRMLAAVVSRALGSWRTVRTTRVGELRAAHRAIGGQGGGRRWRTGQVNRSLTLTLAGEFQGFCRDLHDQAVDHFVAEASGASAPLSAVLRSALTRDRSLDRGNANPGNLGRDFELLGLRLWDAINTAEPQRGPDWNKSLGQLNKARNAIAHAQEGPLLVLRGDGYPMTLATIDYLAAFPRRPGFFDGRCSCQLP